MAIKVNLSPSTIPVLWVIESKIKLINKHPIIRISGFVPLNKLILFNV